MPTLFKFKYIYIMKCYEAVLKNALLYVLYVHIRCIGIPIK